MPPGTSEHIALAVGGSPIFPKMSVAKYTVSSRFCVGGNPMAAATVASPASVAQPITPSLRSCARISRFFATLTIRPLPDACAPLAYHAVSTTNPYAPGTLWNACPGRSSKLSWGFHVASPAGAVALLSCTAALRAEPANRESNASADRPRTTRSATASAWASCSGPGMMPLRCWMTCAASCAAV